MAGIPSSSPDPLAMSNENYSVSPIRRPSISPRKPLTTSSGNARTQDFYITTPPAKPRRKSQDGQSVVESPWRIRLTVQAEQMVGESEDANPHAIQGTTTTMVPLKGGDDESPVIKRGRGRPRKSLEDGRVRNGTPKLKAKPSRKTVSDLDSSVLEKRATTPARYRNRELGADLDSSPSKKSPSKRTPERLVKARPFTRSRSRSRRREITPRKVGSYVEQETEQRLSLSPYEECQDQSALEKSPSYGGVECSPEKSLDEKATEHPSSSNERSSQDIEDEIMWRDMIRKDSVSPGQQGESAVGQASLDPTEQHQEYDTILDSEGFSMVSVDSLRSSQKNAESGLPNTSQFQSDEQGPDNMGSQSATYDTSKEAGTVGRAQVSNDNPATAIEDLVTPSTDEASPIQPPTPMQNTSTSVRHEAVCSPTGTPPYQRALRASAALQSVPALQDNRASNSPSQLGSPYDESKGGDSSSTRDSHQGRSARGNPEQRSRNADLVSGFSAATRRELKAGLRLGEELSKRQRQSLPASQFPPTTNVACLKSQSSPLYPSLPFACSSENAPNHKASKASHQGRQLSSFNPQLPSPASSDAEEMDASFANGMKRQAKIADQGNLDGLGTQSHEPGLDVGRKTDYTMLEREAEWQREREAVKKQIQEANTSQVIVIDGETRLPESTSADRDESSESWNNALQKSSSSPHEDQNPPLNTYRGEAPESSYVRRSRLPSPWMKHAQLQDEGSKSQNESSEADLFWQPDAVSKRKFVESQNRRQRRDEPANSMSPGVTTSDSEPSNPVVKGSESYEFTRANLHPKLGQPSQADDKSFKSSIQSQTVSADSFAENRNAIQPTAELLDTNGLSSVHGGSHADQCMMTQASDHLASVEERHSSADSYQANRDNLQTTEDLMAGGNVTITLSENVPPAIVPLPESPVLNAIDPDLFERPFDESTPFKPQRWEEETSVQPTSEEDQSECTTAAPTDTSLMGVGITLEVDEPDASPNESWKRPPPSTWWSTLIHLVHAGPSCPPATADDILVSSVPRPLPLYLPTIRAHAVAMKPLVWASVLYNPDIFPFNPDGPCSYLLYSDVSLGGWGREFTKGDCGIVEAYLTLLEHRGVRPPKGRGHIDPKLETCHIAYLIVRVWAEMVMDGLTDIKDWKRVRIGNRRQGDRKWTPKDIVKNKGDLQFIHEKRKEFQEIGLPNWKHKGWYGPFKLAKPL